MNCKLNDRAIVTRVRPPSAPGKDAAVKAILGRVVRVVRFYRENGLPFWWLEDPIDLPELDFRVQGIEDFCLTPIRGESCDDDIPAHASDPLTIIEPSEA
ncbi:hypothetical protein PQQ75_25010 [Paraburkholderia aspalathi]|uniref:hypothetical protein n=1 Tax=Paraburkholderia aspalathi TaxID=1324617 RepID=UPI0038BC9D12